MIKKCDMCGKEFETPGNGRTCEECKHPPCPVCGETVELKGPKLTKYKKQGWITCGKQSCAKEMTRRNNLKKYGVENNSQRSDVKEKLRQVRLNDSEETKAKRAASLRESCSKPEVIEKRKQTNLERYGYEAALQDKDIHDRAVKAAATKEARDKAKNTCLDRYGVENPFLISD